MEVLTLPIRKTSHPEDLDVHDATFARPELTTFCRLDELGLEAVGQRREPDRAVLACRVVEPDQWCRRCGCEGAPRDTVVRRLAHEPLGWRPTTLEVVVRRYRCTGCGHVWRHTRRGGKYVTMIIDLTGIRDGTGPARLLDMVEGRSKQAFKTWLTERPEAWRDAVEVEATWGIYQRMIAAYRQEDRGRSRELMVKLIDSISHGVPSGRNYTLDREEPVYRRAYANRRTRPARWHDDTRAAVLLLLLTLMLFRAGQPVWTRVGAGPKARLLAELDDALRQ